MSDGISYYKFSKPPDGSKNWEANLFCLCKRFRINVQAEKLEKGQYLYSLSCPKESFEKLIREMRKRESKEEEPDS